MLKPVAAPQVDFDSVPQVFEKALAQEQTVTQQINSLWELAFNEKQFTALVELEWFIQEQVEEEKTAREIVHKFQTGEERPGRAVGPRPRIRRAASQKRALPPSRTQA